MSCRTASTAIVNFQALHQIAGAFLIPYILCLIFLGIPVFALEVAFGQFGGRGPLTIWYISPAFRGQYCSHASPRTMKGNNTSTDRLCLFFFLSFLFCQKKKKKKKGGGK